MRVVTIGTFDLFHEGHLNLLRFCRDLAGRQVVVGVNADRSYALNFKEPAQNQDERIRGIHQHAARILLRCDVVLNQGRGHELLRQNDIVVVGSDWASKNYPQQLGTTWMDLERMNIAVCYKPRTPGFSSTELRKQLKEATT